ncbi:SWIM zinc finger family protein [Brevibacillus dissolubilis]|uniref:SWIM zinc finger family protein n=1 Tax=Brevibacillus dissolubilis TaxID=1844116 RepID=UPI001116095D|nr:SWIM zinc finger family protein [Brevibacillus dissolubilis]
MSKSAQTKPWWTQRWLAVIESFDAQARSQRGKSYAKDGAVREISLQPGEIHARITGTRYTPYQVTVQLPVFTQDERTKAVDLLVQSPLSLAKLLAGELPEEIEQRYLEAGVSLFPRDKHELHTACTCPDFAVPCKHVIAVLITVGQMMTDDPMLMFGLRGLHKDEVMAKLRESWSVGVRRRGENAEAAGKTVLANSIPHETEAKADGDADADAKVQTAEATHALTETAQAQTDQTEPIQAQTEPVQTNATASATPSAPVTRTPLPDIEIGASFLRRSVDQGTYWRANPIFTDIQVNLDPELVAPDSLPLTWGSPDFLGKKGPEAMLFLSSFLREVSRKAKQQMEEKL